MTNPDASQPDPLDPKEQMRAALDAKKQAQHIHAESSSANGPRGGSQGQQGGKREFRRKSGG